MTLRRAFASALVLLAAATAAQAQPTTPPADVRPAQIDRNGVLILIRSNLLALQQANETGNYTVLRDLAAPSFRDANTAARLGEIFASQRAQNLDLSGVAVLDPQLTVMPQIENSGLMRLGGFFPSVPQQVNFEMLFAPVGGRWRIFGLGVTIGSSTPVAPLPSGSPSAKPEDAKTAAPSPAPAQPALRTTKPILREGRPNP